MNNFEFRIILFAFPFIFLCNFISHSQENYRWFGRKYALYVSAGYMNGKRLVSGLEIYPKDSVNREIHVKLEILENWKIVDSAAFDLYLDTSRLEFIAVDDRKYEAIQYRSKDNTVRVNFEKPEKHESILENGMEWVYWSCNYATVNYASTYNRFKKYRKVLKVYYEK
ncbi:hypothetical protein [Fluviicola sp.]|uniref:hypothetical protein n=1 Tax=Fluviicola sp. TaxID=1917219 RepID=UPI0031D41B80